VHPAKALALLLGPSVLAVALGVATDLDDDYMSATDVSQFCRSYEVLMSSGGDDSPVARRELAARRLLRAAPDSLEDDVRLFYYVPLQLGPQDKSGMDAERAGGAIKHAAAIRCD
jgi:hypothetical protein